MAQEELEMIPAKEHRQAAAWMLSKEECLGHTPRDALETKVEKGAAMGVLLTFSRSPDPGWKCTLLWMHSSAS